MNLRTEAYLAQCERWPRSGQHILAQFDEDSVVVYQAYRPAIGSFAAEHGYFGGDFSLERMSWIKPNFMWMMYRCGWGMKPDQEVVLAIRLQRSAFDSILSLAVHTTPQPDVYADESEWTAALKRSPVRLQWDPDHGPKGEKLERRAIQLGLKGDILRKYAREWIVSIDDISGFCREQLALVQAGRLPDLVTPKEEVYPVRDVAVAARLGLTPG